ncbi:MAG: MaoC family dehydratase [Pseudonocardiaceae bacterium]
MRYLEDFQTGQRYQLGEHTVTAKEILAFAEQWDPQRFHIDPDQARDTPFGGLIASGWHTTSIFMRLYVTSLLRDSSGIGSPGVDDIRWKEPVRPGDTLIATVEIEKITPSLGRPDRGTVKPRCELTNQHGRSVLTMYLHSSFLRRPPPDPAGAQAVETVPQPMWCLPDSEQRSLEWGMEMSERNRNYRGRP